MRRAPGVPGSAAVANAASAVRTGGVPLSRHLRGMLEPRFGQDLSSVRVHTDSGAEGAAQSIGARAFTLGSHIAFAKGEFRPTDRDGQHLLAHELAHTVQQGSVASTAGGSVATYLVRQATSGATAPAPTPAVTEFNFVTLPDEPDLFAVPEGASRTEVAGRLLGDPQLVTSIQFIATGKIPVLDNKPARAVRVLPANKLVPAALTVLQGVSTHSSTSTSRRLFRCSASGS